jgi:hypothetical protein
VSQGKIPSSIWLKTIILALIVLGLISVIYGVLCISGILQLGFLSGLIGFIGIVFGVIDLMVAFVVWRTGKPWFIFFFFGPIIFVPFGLAADLILTGILAISILLALALVIIFIYFSLSNAKIIIKDEDKER